MSERSFVRHYRAGTGRTPARAVEQIRVEAAQRLLGETAWPVKRIAARCGFGSEETLRRCFVRVLGVSPQGIASDSCGNARRAIVIGRGRNDRRVN